MSNRSGLVAVLMAALILFTAAVIQTPPEMRADEAAPTVFLPVVRRAFAPSITPFVRRIAPPSVITGIVDPGDGRLFIATRDGRIQVSMADGSVQPALLLDIRDRVYDDGNEMGFVGLATHPDYASNGLFFVHYNERLIDPITQTESLYSVVARFTTGTDGTADPNSEQRLLQIELPTPRHHGGSMQFGPNDGYLYLAIGDGGTARDRAGYAQSKASLLGKILRIDVDNGDPYMIPADNPFAADPDSRGEIWALGLRNPWRISFDGLTGDLFIGDVGEFTWEEIDLLPASSAGGDNFGWPCMEGPAVLVQEACDPDATYSPPIFYYEHQRNCGSVIGGYLYRGTQIPELAGHYLLADLCRGTMWSLRPDDQGMWQSTAYGDYGLNFTTFGERSDGELFLGAANNVDIYQIIGDGS